MDSHVVWRGYSEPTTDTDDRNIPKKWRVTGRDRHRAWALPYSQISQALFLSLSHATASMEGNQHVMEQLKAERRLVCCSPTAEDTKDRDTKGTTRAGQRAVWQTWGKIFLTTPREMSPVGGTIHRHASGTNHRYDHAHTPTDRAFSSPVALAWSKDVISFSAGCKVMGPSLFCPMRGNMFLSTTTAHVLMPLSASCSCFMISGSRYSFYLPVLNK